MASRAHYITCGWLCSHCSQRRRTAEVSGAVGPSTRSQVAGRSRASPMACATSPHSAVPYAASLRRARVVPSSAPRLLALVSLSCRRRPRPRTGLRHGRSTGKDGDGSGIRAARDGRANRADQGCPRPGEPPGSGRRRPARHSRRPGNEQPSVAGPTHPPPGASPAHPFIIPGMSGAGQGSWKVSRNRPALLKGLRVKGLRGAQAAGPQAGELGVSSAVAVSAIRRCVGFPPCLCRRG